MPDPRASAASEPLEASGLILRVVFTQSLKACDLYELYRNRVQGKQAESWVTLASETPVFRVWSGAWTGVPVCLRPFPGRHGVRPFYSNPETLAFPSILS